MFKENNNNSLWRKKYDIINGYMTEFLNMCKVFTFLIQNLSLYPLVLER